MKTRVLILLVLSVVVSLCGPSQLAKSPTSKIVLRFVWFGADFSAPVQKTRVTVSVAGSNFRKQTTPQGWLVVPNVPCNQNVSIALGRSGLIVRNPGESPMAVRANRLRQVTRYVPCSDKPVAIGVFSWRDGDFIGTDMDNIDGCRTCSLSNKSLDRSGDCAFCIFIGPAKVE